MTRHAEVAGAGIAGLAIAGQLAAAGWSVRVHERAEAVREIGAGIALGQNGVDALRKLGAFEGAIEGGTRIDYWSIEDQWNRIVHGEWLSSELYSIPRSSLQHALYVRAMEVGVEVVTGTAVSGLRDGRLVLSDGQELSADLIVGADGVNSRIRDSFAEAGIRVRRIDLGVAGLRAIMPSDPSDPSHPSDPTIHMLEWLSGKRRVGLLPLNDEEVAIYMFCPPQDVQGRKMPVDVDSWSRSYPRLRAAFERVPDDSTWRDVVEIHCETWALGNAVLLGDAAFGMAPNLGQGGCTALQAAVSLTSVVADAADIPSALKRWESQERPHVDYVQKWSGRYSRMCSKSPAIALRARSRTFSMLARSKRLNDRFVGVEARLAAVE
jgi:2-polyprenyl-6-methoxyphenol hydroxylase-like FAD-dependent oxidoreductase